jgi:hypothetical protein
MNVGIGRAVFFSENTYGFWYTVECGYSSYLPTVSPSTQVVCRSLSVYVYKPLEVTYFFRSRFPFLTEILDLLAYM